MKRQKDKAARYKRIHSNPKIGKMVTNRQHSFFGFLQSNGKISQVLSTKKYGTDPWMSVYTYQIIGIRKGNVRIL